MPSDELVKVPIVQLRPTQISVGMLEVARKRAKWRDLPKKARKGRLKRQAFPAVLGPGEKYFIIDRHHWGLALLEEEVESVHVSIVQDLSWLRFDRFWRAMEFYGWAYPFDERGRRRSFGDIPRTLVQLRDDPHRSLASMVREAGGFMKVGTPFVEFQWADYLRPRIAGSRIIEAPRVTVKQAVVLARSHEARHLPGWNGRMPRRLAS